MQAEHIVFVENTDGVHNLVVCTLCSCLQLPVPGVHPLWYKSAPERSRAVLDRRSVLSEFGLNIPASKEIRVWDWAAEVPCLYPATSRWHGGMGCRDARALVTRDSMIGPRLAPEDTWSVVMNGDQTMGGIMGFGPIGV
jgi:nitrile hydratase